jgi:hypothetical protein
MTHEQRPIWEKKLERRWPFIAGLALAFWTVTSASILGGWSVWVWKHEQEKARVHQTEEQDKFRSQQAADQEKFRAQQQAQSDEQHRLRLMEIKRPFRETQFKLYMETAEVVGKLVSLRKDNPDWQDAYPRFWALHFSVLATVKSPTVSAAMTQSAEDVRIHAHSDNNAELMQTRNSSIELAHAIQAAIQHDWLFVD